MEAKSAENLLVIFSRHSRLLETLPVVVRATACGGSGARVRRRVRDRVSPCCFWQRFVV